MDGKPVVNQILDTNGGACQSLGGTNDGLRGPSRGLRFGYRAFAGSPRLAATATATVDVLPRIELAISPRHTVNGGTINWSGRVLGGPYRRAA